MVQRPIAVALFDLLKTVILLTPTFWLHEIKHDAYRLIVQREAHIPLPPPPPPCLDISVTRVTESSRIDVLRPFGLHFTERRRETPE